MGNLARMKNQTVMEGSHEEGKDISVSFCVCCIGNQEFRNVRSAKTFVASSSVSDTSLNVLIFRKKKISGGYQFESLLPSIASRQAY